MVFSALPLDTSRLVRYEVCFMSLTGKFTRVKTETFPTLADAETAVRAYVAAAGFRGMKRIEDNEYDGYRFTATTPGGRGGRNVAFVDEVL